MTGFSLKLKPLPWTQFVLSKFTFKSFTLNVNFLYTSTNAAQKTQHHEIQNEKRRFGRLKLNQCSSLGTETWVTSMNETRNYTRAQHIHLGCAYRKFYFSLLKG